MKTSKFFSIKGTLALLLAVAVIIGVIKASTTMATTSTPTPTPTPTPITTTPAATPTPKIVERKIKLPPQPTKDNTISVEKPWKEAAIELWGEGDMVDKDEYIQYSYSSSRLYRGVDDVYFTLWNFRVYIYTDRWSATEVYPAFENAIVIDQQGKVLVLQDTAIQVWEKEYSADNAAYCFYKKFEVGSSEPADEVRVFGSWLFDDLNLTPDEPIAYLAIDGWNTIWIITSESVSCKSYDKIFFARDSLYIVDSEGRIQKIASKVDADDGTTGWEERWKEKPEGVEIMWMSDEAISKIDRLKTGVSEGKLTIFDGQIKITIE